MHVSLDLATRMIMCQLNSMKASSQTVPIKCVTLLWKWFIIFMHKTAMFSNLQKMIPVSYTSPSPRDATLSRMPSSA